MGRKYPSDMRERQADRRVDRRHALAEAERDATTEDEGCREGPGKAEETRDHSHDPC